MAAQLDINAAILEMLAALKDVPGHQEFVRFICQRSHHGHDWWAEVMGLFEINKVGHPLVRIDSHAESAAEGEFRVGSLRGMIECAFIRHRFDTSDEVRKEINKAEQSLRSAPIGTRIEIPEYDLVVERTEGGILSQGYDVHIPTKVEKILKKKRRQHRMKTAHDLRVYYVYVDCPPSKVVRAVDECRELLGPGLKVGDVVVITAVGIENGKWHQPKLTMANYHSAIELDFTNGILR